jgi:type II secretion system protein N
VTPERFRSMRRWLGIALFGAVIFFISFALAFPYERVKDQIIAVAAAFNLDMDVGSTGPMLGFGVVMKDVTLRTRPELGKKASVMSVEEARLGSSPLGPLRSRLMDYDISLDTLGGRIEADLVATRELGETRLSTREISMAELPGVKSSIGLPLGGQLDLDLDFKAPNNRNGEGSGSLQWSWGGAFVGDGKEKLRIPGNPLLGEGITFPRIRLGDFKGKVAFTKGVGKLSGVGSRSQDGEIKIEGEVRLADPLNYSYVDLYVTFKLSDALLKANDRLQLMMQIAETMGKRPDGFYGFRLTGSFARMGPVQWMKTSPFPAGGRAQGPMPGPAAGPRTAVAVAPGAASPVP